MKERREVAMLKESAKNADVNGSGTIRDIKEEVKDEVKGRSARSTPDTKPPSNKMANGESGIKEENGGPMSAGSDAKKSPAGGGPAVPHCGPSATCHESVPGFVQQQSQVFVFTTDLANDAAEAVKQGRCKSMIAYHMEQPATKQFLQKNPPKSGLYGRPSSSMPLYHQFSHIGMMGKPGMSPGTVSPHMPGIGPGGPGVGCSVAQWVQQQNANLEEQAMGGMAPYPMNTGGMGPGVPGSRGMGWSHPGMPPGPGGGMGGPGYGLMDSGYEFNPDALGPGGAVSMPHMNLSQNKVPNENLTPEQLERREEQLANLRKIGQMLFPGEQNPMEGGMFMGGMSQQQQSMMSPQQQALMSQHQAAMMGQHCPHPSMMSPSQQQYMMQQQQSMGMGGPGPYPPGHPGGRSQGPVMPGQGPPGMAGSGMGQDMSQMHQAQQAWLQMQQDYYDKKSHQMIQQRSQQAAMMGGMVPQHPMDRGPMNGPPPPYYSSLSGKRQPGPMGPVGSPTSPNMGSPVVDPADPLGMFPSARSRPGMMMDPPCMDSMAGGFGPGPGPGIMGQGMGNISGMGMGMRGMDPVMPGMGPGPGPQQPPIPSGPLPGRPGGGGPAAMMGMNSGVNVVSSTSGRKSAGQATLHRAGNPEQFTPEINSGSMPNTGGSKPPPSYAQAQKRKREDLEDAFKNLQPTPSPTQLTYLNQFEGQELTITKQLNVAFKDHPSGGGSSGGVTPHDPASVSAPPTSHPHNNQFSSPASNSNPVNSPLTHGSNPGGNPPSSKGPLSNSSQTSSTGHLGSPVSLHHGPSPMSGANMRLTHFDPPSASSNNGGTGGATPAGSGMSSAPATPTAGGKQPSGLPTSSSSSMSNITSASLANLAKGVEHLSNQMQQNMMQGGPFHSIQVQGQMSSNGSSNTPNNNGSSSGSSSSNSNSSQPQQQQQQQHQSGPAAPVSQPSGTQPVNNTFLSTNLQIGQVNIQNVTAGSSANMQVQQMTGESPHMNMATGSSSAMMHGAANVAMTSSATANCNNMGGNMPSHMVSHMAQQQHQAMMMSGGGAGGVQASTMGMSQSQSQHMQSPCTLSSSSSAMCTMPHSMPPSSHYPASSPPYTTHHPIPHPLPHPAMSTGMPQSQMSSSLSGAGNRLASPPFPPSTMGNANIQIQPKAPNTIQYLPANPPPSQQPPQSAMSMGVGGGPPAKRPAPDMDFMPRYNSPMDVKNPSSTLQYFPGSPNHGMRHSSAGIGPAGAMSDFPPLEMHQAMMMRGGGPAPQDYGHIGLMGQGMPPGMGMPPGGPAPSPMQSPMGMDGSMRGMEMSGSMTGMTSPMDPMMMGPSPSAMRTMSAMGPGGSGAMDPMSPMSSMMGPGGGSHAGHHYPGAPPSGYMPNGQTMMMSQQMQGSGPAGLPGHPASLGPSMPMSHAGMPRMPGSASSNMRIPMQQSGPGPGSSPVSGGYSAQYQQFQQQLYSQGRSRQMSPMGHMMAGGPAGAGQPYMGMMPTMPGPS